MLERIKGVKPIRKKLADGSERIYLFHRSTGIRLPDDPSSLAFKVALDHADRQADALRSEVKTLSWLIRKYEASDDWTGLAKSTREIGTFDLKAVEAEFGDMPLSDIEERGARSLFLEWRDDLALRHPRAADAKLARLARVLSFGVDREHLIVNPLASFKRVYDGDRSDKIWLPEHIGAFNRGARSELQDALVLALHTGQRRGDLLALEWPSYDGVAISLTQSKTGAKVYIPCTAALKFALDRLKAANIEATKPGEEPQPFILLNSERRPWTGTAFSSAWDRAFDVAFPEFDEVDGRQVKHNPAPPDLHFHDLRGTAVTMLAEAGCTVPEIATITGHTLSSVTKILERYLSRTRSLAHSAIAKLEARMAAA